MGQKVILPEGDGQGERRGLVAVALALALHVALAFLLYLLPVVVQVMEAPVPVGSWSRSWKRRFTTSLRVWSRLCFSIEKRFFRVCSGSSIVYGW